jgi:hypothetical protein
MSWACRDSARRNDTILNVYTFLNNVTMALELDGRDKEDNIKTDLMERVCEDGEC